MAFNGPTEATHKRLMVGYHPSGTIAKKAGFDFVRFCPKKTGSENVGACEENWGSVSV